MADLKISQLSSATALAGTEVVPVVQGGATKKATIDQILAPAAGKGIDFSANGGDILTQYNESAWTPTLALAGGSVTVTYSNQVGRYVQIGKRVFFSAFVTTSTWTHALTANELTMSLPVTPSSSPHQIVPFTTALNYTKANYTQVTGYITTQFWGSSVIFAATGSGQSFDGIVASNVPSGTNLVLLVSGQYDAA